MSDYDAWIEEHGPSYWMAQFEIHNDKCDVKWTSRVCDTRREAIIALNQSIGAYGYGPLFDDGEEVR